MLFGQLALISSAGFAGAALYINISGQPARLRLDDRELLSAWKPSYQRAYAMQAPLAVVGCICGLIACWQGRELGSLVGAVFNDCELALNAESVERRPCGSTSMAS